MLATIWCLSLALIACEPLHFSTSTAGLLSTGPEDDGNLALAPDLAQPLMRYFDRNSLV
jgi:hypothetical protein